MADCASLERMCGGNSTEGSNPSLSAIWAKPNTSSGAAGMRDEDGVRRKERMRLEMGHPQDDRVAMASPPIPPSPPLVSKCERSMPLSDWPC